MLPNDEGLKLYKSAITIDSLYNTIKRTPSKSPQDIPGSQSEIILEKCTEIQENSEFYSLSYLMVIL